MQETSPFDSWVGTISWRREKATHSGNLASRTSPWGCKRQTGLSDFHFNLASLVAQIVKNLTSVREIGVQSLGWEDPGEGNGNPLSLLGWRIPWTEEPGRLQSMGCKELDTNV